MLFVHRWALVHVSVLYIYVFYQYHSNSNVYLWSTYPIIYLWVCVSIWALMSILCKWSDSVLLHPAGLGVCYRVSCLDLCHPILPSLFFLDREPIVTPDQVSYQSRDSTCTCARLAPPEPLWAHGHNHTVWLLVMSEFWLCFNCCIAEQPQPVRGIIHSVYFQSSALDSTPQRNNISVYEALCFCSYYLLGLILLSSLIILVYLSL